MSDLLPATFPGNRRAAVSLTHDDAFAQHLDIAMPQLESFDLRGTFYIPTRASGGSCWHDRPADWNSAAARGHEIANHTQYHPCGMKGRDWVKPNFSLESYTLGRIERELLDATADIHVAVGERGPMSFAYTCCEDWVGPQRDSYRPIVSRLFPAARGCGDRILTDPFNCDRHFIPGWIIRPTTALTDVLRFIDEAIEQGKRAVLTFHGVGGGHSINVSANFHLELLDHIAGLRERLYCDSFIKVAQQIPRG
jgi:peptidoglycan/xylan/chitin deacetylase (PgdA/CDA1 family)